MKTFCVMAMCVCCIGIQASASVVYEGFDYTAGDAVTGQGVATNGWDGAWATSGTSIHHVAGELTFDSLSVSGGSAQRPVKTGIAQMNRQISAASQTALTADNSTLWFSVLMNPGSGNGGFALNTYGTLILGNATLNTTAGNPTIADSGSAIGVGFAGSGGGDDFNDMRIHGVTFNGGVAAYGVTTNTGNTTVMIVGKVEWAANGANDTVSLYSISDLTAALPAAFSIMTADLDQSAFDVVGIVAAQTSFFDEIRFGTTLAGVIPESVEPPEPVEPFIFQDNFSGAGSLHGTTPDTTTNDTMWVAGSTFGADGSVAGSTESATLAFTPETNHLYQLQARVSVTSTGGWLAMGFASGQSAEAGNSFIGGDTTGKAWMLMKGDADTAPNGNMTQGLAAGESVAFSGGYDRSLEDMDFRIDLDTSGTTWSATWFGKLTAESEYTPFRTNDLTNQEIDSVGFAVYGGAVGSVGAFSLSGSPHVSKNIDPPTLQLTVSNTLLNVAASFSSTSNFPHLLQFTTNLTGNAWSNLDSAFATNKSWVMPTATPKGFFRTNKQPNIVYIFADQMRACALGAMGNNEVITPELDQLATEGIMLTQAFSAQPVCSPYRGHILSGRYGHTTGVYHNDIRMPDTELLLPTILKANGYTTGYIGKWHLAEYRSNPVDAISRRDWDYWAVRNVSHDHDNVQYWVNDSTTAVSVPGAWEPTVQTDLAIDFINRNKDKPFCLMVSMGAPHNPYEAPSEYLAMYDDVTITPRPNVPASKFSYSNYLNYYAMITSIDENMGRLKQAIQAAGLEDDTIFVFTSDHGDMLGSLGQVLKQRPWEESIHIPFMIRYPRSIVAGQENDWLFSSIDVMPTLLGLCQIDAPTNIQGMDYSSTFTGISEEERDAVFLFNVANGGNGSLVDWRGIRTKDWVYAYHKDGDWIMYDLINDPYQLNNLVDNPAYAVQKALLKTQLDTMRADLGDTMILGGTGTAPPAIILP